MGKMIRFVAFWDVHVPKHNEHCVKVVSNFIGDFRPHEIVIGGDFMNLNCISHWKEGKIGSQLDEDIESDYRVGNDILDRLTYRKAKTTYLLGNHEDWIHQYGLIYPSVKNIITLEKNLNFKHRKIKVMPLNTVYFIGKLGFMHGIYTGNHHTLQTIRAGYNCTLLYSHSHDRQVETHVEPFNMRHHYTAESCGALCDHNPEYMKNRPSRWMHGFVFGYVDSKTGFFNHYFVKINSKITMIEGKGY